MAKKEDHVCFVYHYYIGMRADNVKQAKKFFFVCIVWYILTLFYKFLYKTKLKRFMETIFFSNTQLMSHPAPKILLKRKSFFFKLVCK